MSAKLGERWWLASSEYCKDGNWNWCYGNEEWKVLDRSIAMFDVNQPDNWWNIEHCAAASVLKDMKLNDLPCDSSVVTVEYPFICEVAKQL